jgi:hypothetical protein
VVVDFLITPAYNHGESQISRDGIRFELPADVARLSFLVDMILEEREKDYDSDDDNDINGRKPIVIPLTSIKSPVLARIVRYLEHYKQEPSEFAM